MRLHIFKSRFWKRHAEKVGIVAPDTSHLSEEERAAQTTKTRKYFNKLKDTGAIQSKFDNKKKKEKRRLTYLLDEFLEKAGYDMHGDEFKKRVLNACILLSIVLTLALITFVLTTPTKIPLAALYLLIIWTGVFGTAYLVIMTVALIFLDYKIYERTKEIEEVLPEYLQLVSANISAGMTIDRALWFAVRPKFGVLAKEIEDVAKSTMAGDDLEEALTKFTHKYDSRSLKEAMNLLIEGMRAGGEIGYLLNQIAANMQDIKIMRKEISASVMSYVIFITAAAIVGAPFLLALSSQLLVVITGITHNIDLGGNGGASAGGSSLFKLDMSGSSISIADFRTFAIIMLVLSSVFSAMIISVIRKGNANESIKIIPAFIVVSLAIFLAASALFGGILGGFF